MQTARQITIGLLWVTSFAAWGGAEIPESAQQDSRFKLGYVVVTHYPDVRNDGTGDSTAGIQQAIVDGYRHNKTVLFPQGEYVISNSLKCYKYQLWSTSRAATADRAKDRAENPTGANHILGAYGHPVVKTPNLNRLAAEGIRFDSAYSPCPVCAPARGALMSGQYVSTCETYDNAAPWPDDMVTIPHYLTLASYDTVLSGKMHIVGADHLKGFDRRLTNEIYPKDFTWTPARPKRRRNSFNPGKIGEQPFFLCVSYHHPHEPFWPPKQYWDLYEGEEIQLPKRTENLEETYSTMDLWLNDYHGCRNHDLLNLDSVERVRRAYYALVSYIDEKVGEMVQALDENGLTNDTVIVFTLDHGDMLCERGMVQKRCFYEWSARIPLIARFPDKRGRRNEDHSTRESDRSLANLLRPGGCK